MAEVAKQHQVFHCVKFKGKKRPQTQFFTHISEREMSHANNRSFREDSVSQNASNNIPREKIEQVTLLFVPQTKADHWKDSWVSSKTVKILHDAGHQKHCSCNQMKQIAFIWMLTKPKPAMSVALAYAFVLDLDGYVDLGHVLAWKSTENVLRLCQTKMYNSTNLSGDGKIDIVQAVANLLCSG